MKSARIKNGSLFKEGNVVVTTTKKNGDEDSKVYPVSGKVKVEPNEKGYILHFRSFSTSRISGGKGGIRGGRSYRQQHIIVDEYEVVE